MSKTNEQALVEALRNQQAWDLKSAAPDLLYALEMAYDAIAWHIPSGSFSDQEEEDLLETIRATISKAKGAK